MLCVALSARAQPLIVATEPQAAAAPLIIAVERGWFAEEGLDVRVIHFHANRTMVMALAEGDVDVALVDLSADAFAMAADHDLRFVAGAEQLNADHPRYAWLVATALSADGLIGLGDKADAIVGLTEAGSYARYLLDRRFSDPAPLFTYVSQGSDVALAAALSLGEVDVAMLPAHLAADLEATGAAVISGWAGQSEGPVSLSVLMTTAAHTRLRPEVMQRFLRAYVRGVRAYRAAVLETASDADGRAGAERAALLELIASGSRRPVDELAAALPYMSADGRLDQRSLAAQLRWWQSEGQCRPDFSVAALVDLEALKGAVASLAADDMRGAAELGLTAGGYETPDSGAAGTAIDPSAAGGP